MEVIDRKRRALKLNLVRLKGQMADLIQQKTLNIENLSKLEAILFEYRDLKSKYEAATDEIIYLLEETSEHYESKITKYMKDLREISEVAFTTAGIIKSFHKKLSLESQRQSLVPTTSDLNASFRAPSNQPKLEKIAVLSFDGNILNFQNFKGLFENLVHNNDELSNVQKLYYLKQALIGEVKDFIRDFKLNDKAYSEAWSHFIVRFENKRAVFKMLFRSLYNLEPIKNENQIRNLLDKVEIIIRGLKAADQGIDDTFSKFITYIVSSKLDSKTTRDWENSITSVNTYPSFNEIQKFLQIRSFNSEERVTDTSSTSSKIIRPPKLVINQTERKSFIANANSNKVKCVVCQEGHFLNQCKVFTAKNANECFDIVKKH